VIQAAQGQAVQIVRQAEAYKAEKIATAQGEAQRFLSVYEQYKLNPSITERRLYLESMQSIFGNMNKVLVAPSAGGAGAIPYLPLDQLLKKAPGAPSASPPSPQSSSPDTSAQQQAAPASGSGQ